MGGRGGGRRGVGTGIGEIRLTIMDNCSAGIKGFFKIFSLLLQCLKFSM